MKSDQDQVVREVADEILGKLTHDEDGSIIEVFQTGRFDPWQLFLYFDVLTKALTEFRRGKNYKNIFLYAQPEGLVGAEKAVTPVKTLLDHVAIERMQEIAAGRFDVGHLCKKEDGSVQLEGVESLKGRTCLIVCDVAEPDSQYLKDCIALCQELKASRVVALPLMVWNPEEVEKAIPGKKTKKSEGPLN